MATPLNFAQSFAYSYITYIHECTKVSQRMRVEVSPEEPFAFLESALA